MKVLQGRIANVWEQAKRGRMWLRKKKVFYKVT